MTEEQGVRLNRFLADAGLTSRRGADRMIEEGRVLINGETAVCGARVRSGDLVEADGKKVTRQKRNVLLLYNKPKGIVCTTDQREEDNIVDAVGYPIRIYPVGRLDRDSHGLILLTNHGDFINDMMRSSKAHEKEYIVRIDRPVTTGMLERFRKGMFLPELNKKTRPCLAEKTSADTMRIILTQGMNRQIRRMCEQVGAHVRDLKRVRIMNLRLDGIGEGQYRDITEAEQSELERLLGRKLWQ